MSIVTGMADGANAELSNARTEETTKVEPVQAETKRSTVGTRLASLMALCGAVGAIGFAAHTVYHVANDGFVAPVILSPDSDMVIQSKLSMSQLVAEKMRIVAKKEAIQAEVLGADQALAELRPLYDTAAKSLDFTKSVTATQVAAGVQDQRALNEQRGVYTKMIADEEVAVERMRKDMEAGLVAKAEFTRALQGLNQLRVGAIENDRAQIVRTTMQSQFVLTQRSMGGTGGSARVATPEMVMQQDQMVRVQCEMIRLESEKRSKVAERRILDEELGKLEELLAQLKARPVFRALEADTNVAFVPYSQIEGVAAGSEIYDCVWSVFACKSVGHVAQLLPGEAVVQDPWGSPARGQFALLDLEDGKAAQSKTLRIRPSGKPVTKSSEATVNRVAKK